MSCPWRDEDKLRELYWEEEMSIPDIADKLECCHSTVHRWMKRLDIERRKSSHEKPVLYRTKEDGYERWRHSTNNTQYGVSVHRLACVAWYGFSALEGKHVHHKNQIPWDNRQNNLELLTPNKHSELHAEDFAVNISTDKLREYIYRDKMSLSEIAEEENHASRTVSRIVSESPVHHPVTPYKRKRVLENLIENHSPLEIAEKFDVEVGTIHKQLNEHDINGWRHESVTTVKDKYDRDELCDMYFERDMTMAEIASELNLSPGSITQIFNKMDIETGYPTSEPNQTPWRDKDWLREKYVEEGMSMYDISELCGSSRSVISKWIHRFELK